jgi:hypothetical protein
MTLRYVTAAVSLSVLGLSGCATPEVLSARQSGDSAMDCKQIQVAYEEAQEHEAKVRKERGVTGTNVAAAIFFWPALLATASNTSDAIDAAKDRQRVLMRLADSKNCKL